VLLHRVIAVMPGLKRFKLLTLLLLSFSAQPIDGAGGIMFLVACLSMLVAHLYVQRACVRASPTWNHSPTYFLSTSTGWPKKLYIFQHTISLKTFKIKLNGFHQNVPRVLGTKIRL